MSENSTNSETFTTEGVEKDISKEGGQLRFIIVPLGVLIAVMLLTLMVRSFILFSVSHN